MPQSARRGDVSPFICKSRCQPASFYSTCQALPDPGSSECHATHISYTTIDSTMQPNDSGMCLFATTLREREVFGSHQSATRLALPGPFPTTVGRRLVPEVWFVQKKGSGLRLETLGGCAAPAPTTLMCPDIVSTRPPDQPIRDGGNSSQVDRMAWPTGIEVPGTTPPLRGNASARHCRSIL